MKTNLGHLVQEDTSGEGLQLLEVIAGGGVTQLPIGNTLHLSLDLEINNWWRWSETTAIWSQSHLCLDLGSWGPLLVVELQGREGSVGPGRGGLCSYSR